MNLHNPLRPKIFHKPSFTNTPYPIPKFYLWPLKNHQIEISMLLPLNSNTGKFFTRHIHKDDLIQTITIFEHDPEDFIKWFFEHDLTTIKHIETTSEKTEKISHEPLSADNFLI